MVSIIIPTYNAACYLPPLLDALRAQTQPHELIIIDSESTDATLKILQEYEIQPYSILKENFNHGATRNLGVSFAKGNILVFLTQDALPADIYSLEKLVNFLLSQDDMAMAYGRQLPNMDATVLSQFARLANYPEASILKTKKHISSMGIKTCACSNSFAVYRKDLLITKGGFPVDVILGEDVTIAAQFILDGKTLGYCAEAMVYHSHNYSIIEEFKRYFDIGVFHSEKHILLSSFTKAESQGLSYIFNEFSFLIQNSYYTLIPEQVIRTFAKYIAYKIGLFHHVLPKSLKAILSMHSYYWR